MPHRAQRTSRKLSDYERKRDFTRTAEPRAVLPHGPRTASRKFVIQEHKSRHPHFDFRIELEGVLKSWAVPKGLPTQPKEKRLAIRVEDHPLSYARFQGVIPSGEYGAGIVTVWDTGTYFTEEEDPAAALAAGKLNVTLAGRKLRGDWALVRMHRGEKDKPQWLVLKKETDAARGPRPQRSGPSSTARGPRRKPRGAR